MEHARGSLFMQCVWWLRRHGTTYDRETVMEALPDHVMTQFFPLTWGLWVFEDWEEEEEEGETEERGVVEEMAAGGWAGEEGESVEGEGGQPMSEQASRGKDGVVGERATDDTLGSVPHKKR